MKRRFSLVLLSVLALALTSSALAQTKHSAAETADELRLKLIEVQVREAELQARVGKLDDDMKPENIQRSLAGVGSTRPEELREFRRRQLAIEKDSLESQLKIVVASREQLESLIGTIDARAYQESAEEADSDSPLNNFLKIPSAIKRDWMVALPAGLIALFGIVLGLGRVVGFKYFTARPSR